jgi:hypothetical protein
VKPARSPQQPKKDAYAKDNRRQDPSSPAFAVQLKLRSNGDNSYTLYLTDFGSTPLPKCQIGNFMAAFRELLSQIAVPALRSAERVRK